MYPFPTPREEDPWNPKTRASVAAPSAGSLRQTHATARPPDTETTGAGARPAPTPGPHTASPPGTSAAPRSSPQEIHGTARTTGTQTTTAGTATVPGTEPTGAVRHVPTVARRNRWQRSPEGQDLVEVLAFLVVTLGASGLRCAVPRYRPAVPEHPTHHHPGPQVMGVHRQFLAPLHHRAVPEADVYGKCVRAVLGAGSQVVVYPPFGVVVSGRAGGIGPTGSLTVEPRGDCA